MFLFKQFGVVVNELCGSRNDWNSQHAKGSACKRLSMQKAQHAARFHHLFQSDSCNRFSLGSDFVSHRKSLLRPNFPSFHYPPFPSPENSHSCTRSCSTTIHLLADVRNASSKGLPPALGNCSPSSLAIVGATTVLFTSGSLTPDRTPAPERMHIAFILGSFARNP